MTILNKTPIMGASYNFTIILVVLLLILFITLTFCYKDDFYVVVGIFVILVGGLASATIEENFTSYETGRYKYEVILEDSYSAARLHEKYNVIDQRGGIWVIEDKE